MSSASVTTIIPAYNASATIRRAVESVLHQTCPAAEVLVIDDGSAEDPASVLSPYQGKVRLFRQLNGGAASARNLGIEQAHGDFLAFLDADDYWEPTKLERQLDVLKRHPAVGLVAGGYFVEDWGGPRHCRRLAGHRLYDRVLRLGGEATIETASEIWTSTVVVRREALGEHRFVSGLEPAEDRDLWIRLVASHPVYLDSEPLATAVLTSGSLSRSSIEVDCTNMMRVVHRHRDLLGKRGVRKWEAHVLRRLAGGHLEQGRPRKALESARSRLRREPWSPEAWWIVLKSAWQSTRGDSALRANGEG
jgi:glycosyltransferase involved in cell wall biosynthesis